MIQRILIRASWIDIILSMQMQCETECVCYEYGVLVMPMHFWL